MAATTLCTALLLSATFTQSAAPIDVRVGIVAYEDFLGEYSEYQQLFAEIAQREPNMHFRLAVGSYGEVLHWIDHQQIDLAILTPGVFAGLLAPQASGWETRMCDYVATVQLPTARSRWASAERRTEGFSDHYQSVCLVAADSPLQSVDDLRRLAQESNAQEGKVEYLFVHPLSVSGHAAPREALRQANVKTAGLPIRFTYSHSQSIRMLLDRGTQKERVAFVWDDAAGNDPTLEEGVRRLPFPELERIEIPHDVVVARKGFRHASLLRELLLAPLSEEQRFRFVQREDWRQRFEQVHKWLDATGAVTTADEGENISLDEIGHLLLQYARSGPRLPRLALVLSGGGAKCSYQVGAVAAIEKQLSQLRRENPRHQLDIQLVVGTSGGAINSLPVALGVSGSAEGRQAFYDTWTELNQCEIIRPPLAVRINMGLWFALLQTALIIWVVRWRVRDENRRGWAFAAIYTLLAGAEILLGYVAPPPWRWLGMNHVLHHLWLWFSFGVKASAWSLFAIGLGALLLQAIRSRRGDHIRLPRRITRTLLVTGLLGLPLLQVLTMCVLEETLSSGEGMENALARKFPRLINRDLASRNQLPLEVNPATPAARTLQEVSEQIMQRGLLERDLVITGSCLDQTSQELPSDLYFFAPSHRVENLLAQGEQMMPYGERGVSLLSHPQILLDVIMGSGSIYPLFPARRIEGIPRPGEQIELVDGGFAHNSPIEAAVLWGATHIILIDVTPRGRIQRGNFLQNATSSVRHLHRQAQLLDARSRERATVFTLSPEPPHICIIDFADNLVAESIEQGERDAGLDPASRTPRFHKQLGAPVFQEAGP